ncbi:g7200 [Coccomyxa elongata]
MSNRVYDEATLLQVVALANAAAQLQQQSSDAQMEMPDLFPALSAMSQAGLLDLVQRSSSQVPEYRETDLEPAPSEPSMAELPREPPPLQSKAAGSAEPLVSRSAAPRSRKQERTAETFRRGCARLRTIQETEEGRLFASRSQWNDLRSAIKQTLHLLGKQLSLWKTAIQTVEAKHGSNVSLTLYFLRFALGINAALFLFWLGGAVIPFIISPPATFSWSYFQTYKPLDLLQGYGLHNTFLLYGGYNYGDTVGGAGDFRLDISFPLEIVAAFFFSLVMLLSTIHKRLQAFGLVIVWPVMVGGTALAVHLIVTNQDAIARHLGFSFASTIALSLVNVISTLLVHMTVVTENWHPRQRTNVEALKLLSIKLINTSTFVYQLYRMQTAASGETTGTVKEVAALQGHCLPGCDENAIGLYFYRLLLTNMVTLNLVDILMACMYRLLGMAVTFDPPSVVIAIIDTEIFVWLGSMYAPLLPFFGLLSNVVTFNTKRFLSLYLYTPPQERYSASRTNVVVYTLMLVILTGCSVPMVFNLQYGRKYCGPHQGISMTGALSNAVSQGPRILANILTWAVSPFVLGGLCVVLGFFLLVTQGQRAHFKKDKEHLRMEFEQYRHQMQAKVVIARKLKGRTLSTVSESSSEGSGEVRITAIAALKNVERSGPSGPVSRLASSSKKAVQHQ